ncbi:hypothetical protein F4677DRAFT_442611 [Hypoxylon crocopeplum]|nr:hypothetical protein F4677DRAFT_442611 [Hypoxylon crocopeplum]
MSGRRATDRDIYRPASESEERRNTLPVIQSGGGGNNAQYHAGFRPFPPGPLYNMNSGEAWTLGGLAGTPESPIIIEDNVDPNWYNNLNLPDNPPLQGRNRTTIGVEFEFLAAVAESADYVPDQHPSDDRWLSNVLARWNADDPKFKVTVRNVVVDYLNDAGVVTSKSVEFSHIRLQPTADFGWADSLVEIETNPNPEVLDGWFCGFAWDANLSDFNNCRQAVEDLVQDFVEYHEQNDLVLFETQRRTVDAIARDKVTTWGPYNLEEGTRRQISRQFAHYAKKYIEQQKTAFERRVRDVVDPRCVQLPGSDPKYWAWTCTTDVSVGTKFVRHHHYQYPHGYVHPQGLPDPPEVYKWFNGEMKTPILDFDGPDTFNAIRRACRGIRDHMRIHKPMEAVGTGIHIHLGQEAGWTLLHLKKFTTFWLLTEESLEHLHRRDRSRVGEFSYCPPLRFTCPLAQCMTDNGDRQYLPRTRSMNPQKSYNYNVLMQQYVPTQDRAAMPDPLRWMIQQVWQYSSIDSLVRAMGGSQHAYAAVRYCLSGLNFTDPPDKKTQTLEFRLMQGTLDADHIRRWATICQRIVLFSRDTSPEMFSAGISDMINGRRFPYEVLQVPTVDMAWFELQVNRATDYFEYPDNDRVHWQQPFMTKGWGDTHR